MRAHNVTVYTTKEDIEKILEYDDVLKVIEIDEDVTIIYYDTGLIEVWKEDKTHLYHDDIEEYMEDEYDENIQYFYRYEFSLEKYL